MQWMYSNTMTIARYNMKRPLSPDYVTGNDNINTSFLSNHEEMNVRDEHMDSSAYGEKKRLFYTLCEVCNIQLNSAAQVQVHFNGKSHLKRVKQLNNGKVPTTTTASSLVTTTTTTAGSTCHTTTFPALVRTSNLMMQSSLEIKPFISFPMDCSPAVSLFPNFNTMDPIQKAVINHTFGVSLPPKKKQVITCTACQLRFNSDFICRHIMENLRVQPTDCLSQAEAHYKGSKHAKKVKSMESSKNKQRSASSKDSVKAIINSTTTMAVTFNCSDKPGEMGKITLNNSSSSNLTTVSHAESIESKRGSTVRIANTAIVLKNTNGEANSTFESEEEKARKLLYCSLCKVAVNSLSQLEAHNIGSKHKTMLEARNGAGPIKAYPRPGSKLKLQNGSRGSGLQNKTFHCEICDVHVNSEVQLKQHISSRRHKDRVAGKPMKPKYSPYNKHQRSPSILAAKMAYQKEMVKPLPPAFLSSPFGAAVSSHLSFQPRSSTPLFQATTLSPALLRAGPGPIRTAPTPILFAPY